MRYFAVHDNNKFSIQQMIRICTTRIAGADDCWKGEKTKSTYKHEEAFSNTHQVFVWLDAGKPLNSSPVGPWSSPVDDVYLIPVGLYKPGIALKDYRYPGYRSQGHRSRGARAKLLITTSCIRQIPASKIPAPGPILCSRPGSRLGNAIPNSHRESTRRLQV